MSPDTLHFSDISIKLQQLTGVTHETAEEFLKAISIVLSQGLHQGKSVDMNFFGIFGISTDGKKINFIPSKSMIEEVNSAFGVFNPEILSQDYPKDLEDEANPETSLDNDSPQTDGKEKIDIHDGQNVDDSNEENLEITSSTTVPETEPASISDNSDIEVLKEVKTQNNLMKWIILAVVIIGISIGFIIGFLLRPVIIPNELVTNNDNSVVNLSSEDNVNTTLIQEDPLDTAVKLSAADETKTVIDKAEIVLDTIRPGRFLATMSRRHYNGRYEFWIYIYKENQGKIPDPQNVPIGTVLVIPPAEKYGIDPNSRSSIEKALRETRDYENSLKQNN